MAGISTTLNCPSCGRQLSRSGRGHPKTSKKAAGLYVVAAVAAGLWAVVVMMWSPVFLVPKGLGGIAFCAAFYLWPGLAIGFYASSLPKVRHLRCARCHWSATQPVGQPPRA